jgi:hypothetical protein
MRVAILGVITMNLLLGGCSLAPTQIALVSLEYLGDAVVFELMSDRTINYAHGLTMGISYADDYSMTGLITETDYLGEVFEAETFGLSEEIYNSLKKRIAILSSCKPPEIPALQYTSLIQVFTGDKLYVDSYAPNRGYPRTEMTSLPESLLEVGYFITESFPEKCKIFL